MTVNAGGNNVDEKMMQMLTQLIEGQNETNKQLSELTNRVGGFESKVDEQRTPRRDAKKRQNHW
jgi:hypothetical protein